MSKKSKRKKKVKGLVDKLDPNLESEPILDGELHPDLRPEKEYRVREIDYLSYNTLFSIQQLLDTFREIKQQQREIRHQLSRIESRLTQEDDHGDEGEEEGQEEVNTGQNQAGRGSTDV